MKAKLKISSIRNTIYIICTLNLISIISFNNTNALEYSSNAGINFTISPSISVSVSGDLIIDELAPGSSSDSNIVIVNVSTNNVNGYNLSSTVGNNTDTSPIDNSLIHNTTNLVNNTVHSNVFTSLSPNDSLSSLSSFSVNTWGYSYSTDSGTTWSNYSGLPLYTNTSGTATLSEKYIPSNDNIDFKIAAYADDTQSSGEYTNKINFIAIAFPNPMSLAESYAYFNKTTYKGYYSLQDMSPGICATATALSELQAIDIRDDKVYHIGKLLDNRCWLLDNLKLDPTDTDVQANLTDETTNATNEALECLINGGCFSPYTIVAISNTTNFNSLSNPMINTTYANSVSSDSLDQINNWQNGNYYNFCAASAGTYCYEEAPKNSATQDLCPINWRLPTGENTGEYRVLYNIKEYSNRTNYRNALHLPLPGSYSNVIYDRGSYGVFWSSTWFNRSNMYYMIVTPSSINSNVGTSRSMGQSVRCIANN